MTQQAGCRPRAPKVTGITPLALSDLRSPALSPHRIIA
jgi:hypothetical protein